MTLRRLWNIGLGALAVITLLLGYFWFSMLSPWGYDYPEEFAAQTGGSSNHKVFVYGTLRLAPLRWLVMGRVGAPEQKSLTGYQKTGLTLEPKPGHQVEGELLRVSGVELRRLDRYERLGVRYRRVRVTLDDGTRAWVYLRID